VAKVPLLCRQRATVASLQCSGLTSDCETVHDLFMRYVEDKKVEKGRIRGIMKDPSYCAVGDYSSRSREADHERSHKVQRGRRGVQTSSYKRTSL